MNDIYGFGENPPYSLYQNEEGKWGLIDGKGNKLKAVFLRGEKNCFSCIPWEVVTFDPTEGFTLQAWYDPCEVWFNFTFDDPAYPEEFAGFLWKGSEREIEHYRDTLYKLLPIENHWLIDEILQEDTLVKKDDDDYYWTIEAMLLSHPELKDPAISNPMLDPVMRNAEVDNDIKIALWQAKVRLDSDIRIYKEDYPDGM